MYYYKLKNDGILKSIINQIKIVNNRKATVDGPIKTFTLEMLTFSDSFSSTNSVNGLLLMIKFYDCYFEMFSQRIALY